MSVSVLVEDSTGDRRSRLELPAEATVGQVRPRIVEALHLDSIEFDDQPVSWVLYNESAESMPVLSDTERVGDVLRDEQTIRAVPNVIAGADCHD